MFLCHSASLPTPLLTLIDNWYAGDDTDLVRILGHFPLSNIVSPRRVLLFTVYKCPATTSARPYRAAVWSETGPWRV